MDEDVKFAKEMLQPLDSKIIHYKYDLAKLISLYFKFWRGLKKIAGTASGFTGLSEYIILRAILMYLNEKLGIDFRPCSKVVDPKTREAYSYFFISSDKKIIITHSTSINNQLKNRVRSKLKRDIVWRDNANKLRPDFVIFKAVNDRYVPVAVVQVKIYPVNTSAISSEKKNFEKMDIESLFMAIILFCEVKESKRKRKENRTAFEILHEIVNNYKERVVILMLKDEDQVTSLPQNNNFETLLDKILQRLR